MKYILIISIFLFYSSWLSAGRLHGVATSSIAVGDNVIPYSDPVDGIEDATIISLSTPELTLFNRNNFSVTVTATIKAIPSSMYNDDNANVSYGNEVVVRQNITIEPKNQHRIMLRELFFDADGQILSAAICDSELQNFAASAGATSLNSYATCAATDFMIDLYWRDEFSTNNSSASVMV